MAVTKLSNSGIKTGVLKYDSMLAGNPPFSPNKYESIATVNGTGSSAVITLSAIPSTYQHLQIRFVAKGTRNGSNENLDITFNGDTGTNYSQHRLRADGVSTIQSGGGATASSILINNPIPASSTTFGLANMFGVGILDIFDYSVTTKAKVMRLSTGFTINGATTEWVQICSGAWRNNSAITSITFTATDSLTSNTSFALYGIKV